MNGIVWFNILNDRNYSQYSSRDVVIYFVSGDMDYLSKTNYEIEHIRILLQNLFECLFSFWLEKWYLHNQNNYKKCLNM